jgi:hypothetical protein
MRSPTTDYIVLFIIGFLAKLRRLTLLRSIFCNRIHLVTSSFEVYHHSRWTGPPFLGFEPINPLDPVSIAGSVPHSITKRILNAQSAWRTCLPYSYPRQNNDDKTICRRSLSSRRCCQYVNLRIDDQLTKLQYGYQLTTKEIFKWTTFEECYNRKGFSHLIWLRQVTYPAI